MMLHLMLHFQMFMKTRMIIEIYIPPIFEKDIDIYPSTVLLMFNFLFIYLFFYTFVKCRSV